MPRDELDVSVTSGSSPSPNLGKAGYGIDDPRTIIELIVAGVLSVCVGLIIPIYTSGTREDVARTAILVGPGVGFLLLVVATALFWSSRLGKVREMTKIINDIPWGGGEVVLDMGCGRGLAMVTAAKRLEAGYSIGVDTFSKARIWGNDPRSVYANAALHNVESKVTPARASSARLPLRDSSVDVILSGVAIHHLVPRRDRGALFVEMARVLKEGGRVGILDAGNGGEYSQLLNQTGFRDIHTHRLRFSSFPPFHVVLARKPYRD